MAKKQTPGDEGGGKLTLGESDTQHSALLSKSNTMMLPELK